jgi:hypothetical protein
METQGVEVVTPLSQEPDARAAGGRQRWRWAVRFAVALVAAGALVALALAWQERTLRAAQQELEQGNPQRALALVSYFLDAHPNHGRARALSVINKSEPTRRPTIWDLGVWGLKK